MFNSHLNLSWRSHPSNIELYDELTKVTSKVCRMHLARQCVRHDDVAHKLVESGRRTLMSINTLQERSGMETTQQLKTIMIGCAERKSADAIRHLDG